MTPRAIGYSAILVLLLVLQGFLFGTRTDVEAVILRTPGMLYQKVDETWISNLYNYEIINKTTQPIGQLELRLPKEVTAESGLSVKRSRMHQNRLCQKARFLLTSLPIN
jgi:hypothetical protein